MLQHAVIGDQWADKVGPIHRLAVCSVKTPVGPSSVMRGCSAKASYKSRELIMVTTSANDDHRGGDGNPYRDSDQPCCRALTGGGKTDRNDSHGDGAGNRHIRSDPLARRPTSSKVS